MGIQIRLFVDTDRISEESRKKVYDESLLLLDAYPFMDEIWDYERFANRKEEEPGEFGDKESRSVWKYLDRAKDRYIPEIGSQGWTLFGDLESMDRAEQFMLIKDLPTTTNRYRKTEIRINRYLAGKFL